MEVIDSGRLNPTSQWLVGWLVRVSNLIGSTRQSPKRRCWRTAASVMLCAQKCSLRRRDAAALIRFGRRVDKLMQPCKLSTFAPYYQLTLHFRSDNYGSLK